MLTYKITAASQPRTAAFLVGMLAGSLIGGILAGLLAPSRSNAVPLTGNKLPRDAAAGAV